MLVMVLSICTLTAEAQEAKAETGMAQMATDTWGVWTSQMQAIARNNNTLRAMHASLEATRLANSADNTLPDPEAEVAYMFGNPKGVPNRTNVSVTQAFDWGVLT